LRLHTSRLQSLPAFESPAVAPHPLQIFLYKQNAGCRFLRFVIRHSSRCAAKTELCVTVIFFEALVSFDSKVFTAYPQMIN
jgi:hypothetical protein